MKISINLLKVAIVGMVTFLSSIMIAPGAEAAKEQNTKTIDTIKPELRLGIIDTFDPYFYLETFVPTVEYLVEKLPQYSLQIVEISHLNLLDDLARKKPNFLLSSSGTFTSLLNSHGAQQIVTRRRRDSPDVSASTGATIIVQAARADIQSLADLKDKVVAAYHPDNFEAWTTAQNEIAKLSYNPEKFYKKIVFTHYLSPDISTLVAGGVVDAGILPSCRLEKLLELGLVRKGEFRVLNPKKNGKCMHSTQLFPDAVFSHFPDAGSKAVRDVSVALMTGLIGEDQSFEWLPAANFLSVYDLQKNLKIGNFSHLRNLTLQDFIKNNRHWLILACAVILGAVIHIVRVNILVKKTTDDLMVAVREKETAERRIRENKEKLEQLEKSRVLGHITAIFAHEIKQPLTAIIYYSSILKEVFRMQKLADPMAQEAISQMAELSRRISDIVDHVRSRVRTGSGERKPCDIREVVTSALKNLRSDNTIGENCFLEIDIPKGCYVLAEPLETELAFLNLLKNSAQAVKGRPNPWISLKLRSENDNWILEISDEGKNISDETFKRLGKAFPSKSSSGGLGIGLSLVVEIIESLGGNVLFKKREPYGLCVEVRIPKISESSGDRNFATRLSPQDSINLQT